MARPGLQITLAVNDDCDDLLVTDSTGAYNATTNPDGYGLPDGPTLNNITGCVVVLAYADGSYLTFTFTIVNQVITAATLGLSGATATSILSSLASTVWPLSSFSFFRDYNVDIPAFEDQVFTVTYTITGTTAAGAFNYTTSGSIANTCSVCCCVQEMGANLNLEGCCENDEIWEFILARTHLRIAGFATNVGNTTNGQLALEKAVDLCENGCNCN